MSWDFLPDFKDRLTENRIVRIFFNADLRCSHDGLREMARLARFKIDDLRVGEFVVFVNTRKSQLKIYAPGNTVAHFRMPGTRQINLKVLSLIPRFFNGTKLKYDEALAELIGGEIRN